MALKTQVMVFMVITPCIDVAGHQKFEDLAASLFKVMVLLQPRRP
jgi:hypothetical protein